MKGYFYTNIITVSLTLEDVHAQANFMAVRSSLEIVNLPPDHIKVQ